MSDIIDLQAYRARRRRAEAETRSGVEIRPDPDSPGKVQFRFAGPGFDSTDLEIDADGAEAIGRRFLRAARQSENMLRPQCRTCGEHGCRKWHEGHLLEYLGARDRPVAAVVRICKTTARLRYVETGREFYARLGSVMWRRRDEQLDLI